MVRGDVRENVLRDLATRAATDPEFLRRLRENPEDTPARFGYDLDDEDLRLVEDLHRRTALMSDEDLARLLAGVLKGRTAILRPGLPPLAGAGQGPRDLRVRGWSKIGGRPRQKRGVDRRYLMANV